MLTKMMGLMLFMAGMILISLTILALLGMVESYILAERLLMFAGGLILCTAGYAMARNRPTLFE